MNKTYYPGLDTTVIRHTLACGLDMIVVPTPGFRKKLAYFVTDYGSIHRHFILDGQTHTAPAGVAHYLEHKLFDMPDGEVSAKFAALGANVNAFTSYDMTAYYFSCTDRFEDCLTLLLDFVSTPYFTEESVQKEQGIIGQEIGMTADNPDTRIFENLMDAMYTAHGVREPILGTKESIAQITPQVLELCHRAFYQPGNMLLCVIGDVDPEAVCTSARQVLGDTPTPVGIKRRDWDEEMTCPKAYVEQEMEVAMPMFQLGFKCESIGTGEQAVRREIVADLAAEALFGESSALYLELYEKGIIDGSFGGGFETLDGMAMLTASGDSEDPQAVRDAILERAKALAEQGIPESQLTRMKRSALGRRIRSLDSFDSTCFRLCAYHFTKFDYMKFPDLYRQVQVEELQEFLRRVVTPQRCCLSVILPIGGNDHESQ